MKQPMFIKNTPIDEKRIDFIERVVARLARRTRNVVKTIIPPVPYSSAVYGENIVGSINTAAVFEGKLTKVLTILDKKPKGVVVIEAKCTTFEGTGGSYSIATNKRLTASDLDITIPSPSILEVSIMPTNEEDKITSVISSVLWTPAKRFLDTEVYLIDELEKSADDLLSE